MDVTIYTLFPHWFEGPLGDSVIERARQKGLLNIRTVNFRDYTEDRHKTVDFAPYGGGGGMVLMAGPIAAAMDDTIGAPGTEGRPHVIYLSPRGRVFTQDVALELAAKPRLALLCGHYEAVDQRLLDSRVDEEISLGDFVLTGGEIPAMALVDAVARLVPGVLGNETSAPKDSFMNGLLEGPHYTRPENFEGQAVPEVLLSGNHAAIERWREEQSLAITGERRPDLLKALLLQPEQIRRLARRRRPFVVYERRHDGTITTIHFASNAVLALPEWRELLARQRGDAGLLPSIRVVEIKEARSESAEQDRGLMIEELKAAPQTRFVRAMRAEVEGRD